jgi:hypothetical protein
LAYGRPALRLGERLAVVVVLKEGAQVTEKAMKA